MRIMTQGTQRQGMEWRLRDPGGYLRSVGQGHLVCAEPRKRPEGRRQDVACTELRGTARQMGLGSRRRWAVEVWQKHVTQSLGFEEVATRGCAAVRAHGHGV